MFKIVKSKLIQRQLQMRDISKEIYIYIYVYIYIYLKLLQKIIDDLK